MVPGRETWTYHLRDANLVLVVEFVGAGDEPEERATVSLGSDGGETVTLRLPQQQLCQLLMGYRGIDDVRRQHPDACAKEVVTVLRALLPEGYPHMWSIDHF